LNSELKRGKKPQAASFKLKSNASRQGAKPAKKDIRNIFKNKIIQPQIITGDCQQNKAQWRRNFALPLHFLILVSFCTKPTVIKGVKIRRSS